MDRYDRQARVKQIGAAGQAKISASTILIVGCGALGSYAAEQLVRAGVKQLYLVDPDTVSETNLQRQTLFTEIDAAQANFKVEAAAHVLRQINHEVAVTTFPVELRPELLAQMDKPTLALDCTDNFSVRDTLNRLALNQHFPYIFSGCAGVSGNLMFIDPSHGPCLNCAFPNLAQLKERDCDVLGVATPLIPLVSAQQIALAMRYIVEGHVANNQLMTISCWPASQQQFQIKKQSTCPICSQEKVAVPVTDRTLLRTMCGSQAYSVYLPTTVPLAAISNLLKKEHVTFQATKAFINFQWHGATVSYFKTGKLHLYDLANKNAAEIVYRDLWHLFKGAIQS
ncbi:HesA/MoeB/ThiF family protein [Loigolactobacillus iwatensis]|uniref:HesA/MoeB/ThiF family protein n=1 Tax=Loigolactobacillus iwatensis TaxID=1267156 RepID=UPI000F7ECCAF|nr:HesA/MoeB/ThiF family protein [Loigolactobacillus iwatensis]